MNVSYCCGATTNIRYIERLVADNKITRIPTNFCDKCWQPCELIDQTDYRDKPDWQTNSYLVRGEA